MAAIFKNGEYECRISQNAPYLKLEDQKMYILSRKETCYVKLFMKYRKASFLFSMAAILNIAKNGGSIKISGCFHQNSEIVWHGGHLCQISCFCPDVKIYYIKRVNDVRRQLFTHGTRTLDHIPRHRKRCFNMQSELYTRQVTSGDKQGSDTKMSWMLQRGVGRKT